jgi:alpha-beta hydrolase superfamily lysophospholipase
LKDVLAGLAAASGVGYLAASYTISRWLTRPARGRPAQTPSDHGLTWERLECRTADGFRLAGWAVTPSGARATVALFHGLRGNRTDTLSRTAFLAAAGYRCVAFDHRAHGESEGRRSSFGFLEGRDVLAVLDLIRRRWPDQPRAALGVSMGAAALCFAGPGARGFDALILESLYHDLASTFRNRIGRGYPHWLKRFLPGIVWVTEKRLGLRLSQVVPAEWVGALRPAPLLILTGGEDDYAPPADAQRLCARCQGAPELHVIAGAGHRDVCELGGLAYRRCVLGFLERHLAQVAPV